MKNLMKLSVVLVAAALVFSSCNCFKKMAKNRDDINLTVTPEILTLNNGIVAADINVTFPVKYFNAKAVIKVTPVIVFEGGEVAGAAKYLQGSKVDENYTVVDKKNGGNFTQHVEFPYDPRMDQCALQLRAEIKCPGGKCKEFTLVNLNTGAIPTKEQAAVLAGNDEAAKAALAKEFGLTVAYGLNTLQKDGPAAWAALPEEELFTPAGFSSQQAEATASTSYSYWGSTFRAFFKNKLAVALLAALAAVVVFAFAQPLLPGQADPNLCAVDPATGIQYRNIAPGQQGFLWGSNSIGQDLWARIWAGARTSLTIAFFVAVIEAAVGITAGVLWGYVRGLDFLFTELYNIFDNIPTAIVLILISYVATPSIWTMILGMSIKGWIEMARFIRNQILIIRDRDYNVASRCIGTPTLRIVLRNLLPYLVSVIMLRIALTIPEAIGNEVFITYIGLGLSVETPSLGNLVNDGRKVMMQAGLRYQLLYPTLILSFVTIAFYLIGNAFSDAADPKNHLQ